MTSKHKHKHDPIPEAEQEAWDAVLAQLQAETPEGGIVPYLAPLQYGVPAPEQQSTPYVPPILSPFPDVPFDGSVTQSVAAYKNGVQPPWDRSLRPGELFVEIPLSDYLKNPRLWAGTRPRNDTYGDAIVLMDNIASPETSAVISGLTVASPGPGVVTLTGTVAPNVQVEAALFLVGGASTAYWGQQMFSFAVVNDAVTAGALTFSWSGVRAGTYNAVIRQRHFLTNVQTASVVVS